MLSGPRGKSRDEPGVDTQGPGVRYVEVTGSFGADVLHVICDRELDGFRGVKPPAVGHPCDDEVRARSTGRRLLDIGGLEEAGGDPPGGSSAIPGSGS